MEDKEAIKPVQQGGTEQEPPREQKPEINASEKKDYFEIAYTSVLGFLCAILVFVAILFAIAGIGYLIKQGYNRWFCTDRMVKVGEKGYYYNAEKGAFYKIYPNRCALEGCKDLVFYEGDTIGVVQANRNQYRYINLNTLTFINEKSYYRADLFRDGRAVALSGDTLYVIAIDGHIVSSELSNWVYSEIEEITYYDRSEIDGLIYYNEISTGVYKYRDVYNRYGLMSSDFKRLTPALYTDIVAKSKDIFFCEYLDSSLGILIDKYGKIVK